MPFEQFWVPESESERRFREGVEHASVPHEEEEENAEGESHSTEDDQEYEEYPVPDNLIPTADMLGNTNDPGAGIMGLTIDTVYDWYAGAIQRRGREPLEKERFISHFDGGGIDPTYMYGTSEKGFILGFWKYGIFVPTHFAPKTMRGGYTLMQELGDSLDIPAVLSVTDDLRDTIQKIPSWHAVPDVIMGAFRDALHEKVIMYNSHPNVIHRMIELVNDMKEEFTLDN